MMLRITREQAADMAQAHAEGYHAELPREGCPECEERPLRDYPLEGTPEADAIAARHAPISMTWSGRRGSR